MRGILNKTVDEIRDMAQSIKPGLIPVDGDASDSMVALLREFASMVEDVASVNLLSSDYHFTCRGRGIHVPTLFSS